LDWRRDRWRYRRQIINGEVGGFLIVAAQVEMHLTHDTATQVITFPRFTQVEPGNLIGRGQPGIVHSPRHASGPAAIVRDTPVFAAASNHLEF
jgi:hypothetical protein